MRVRIDFDDGVDRMQSRLVRLDHATKQGLGLAFDVQAARSTAYMKTNAPWSDRTTAARNGLHAITNHGPGRYELILSHAVYYGIFLEVCNSGKYQIILPSLRQAFRELQNRIDGMWGRL
jgi:hypothetical protein